MEHIVDFLFRLFLFMCGVSVFILVAYLIKTVATHVIIGFKAKIVTEEPIKKRIDFVHLPDYLEYLSDRFDVTYEQVEQLCNLLNRDYDELERQLSKAI